MVARRGLGAWYYQGVDVPGWFGQFGSKMMTMGSIQGLAHSQFKALHKQLAATLGTIIYTYGIK